MAIPEQQLNKWAKQGSITQSADTYATIKGALRKAGSPFANKTVSIHLQGSYGNDTNVYGVDSDVDIVCCLEDTFHYNIDAMNAAAKDKFLSTSTTPASYKFSQFKADVSAWLKKEYPNDASVGSKAIRIAANNGRRNADVLPCILHRRYRASSIGADTAYDDGIYFTRSDGTDITNFPVQHSENCTLKHKATAQWFKPTVRIFKNMRNRMIDKGLLAKGVAPSYFIEGMLWNVPKELFGTNYQAVCAGALNWLRNADETNLACANDLHWLIRPNSPICWKSADFKAFVFAAIKQWNEWVT